MRFILLTCFFLFSCSNQKIEEKKSSNAHEPAGNQEYNHNDTLDSLQIFSDTAITVNADTILQDTTKKARAIEQNFPPPLPECNPEPYSITQLLQNHTITGDWSNDPKPGKNIVASYSYNNDLMKCPDIIDGWYETSSHIELKNFEALETNKIYQLPHEYFNLTSSSNSAWGFRPARQVGGKIIFHKLTKSGIRASIFLIKVNSKEVLLNKRDVSFSLNNQKFTDSKHNSFLTRSEIDSFIASLPPQPKPAPRPNAVTADTSRQQLRVNKNYDPSPEDTAIYTKGLTEKAKYRNSSDISPLVNQRLVTSHIDTDIPVEVSYVIEKNGKMTNMEITYEYGILPDNLKERLFSVLNYYSRGWEPARINMRPVRSLNKTVVTFSPPHKN